MLREFSKELVEDRQFEIGGELFEWRYPYWEDFAAQRDADAKIVQEQAEKIAAGQDEDTQFKIIVKDYIDRIEPYLDPKNDSIKRWRALSKRKVDPVPAYQFTELFMWLVEVTSARPTEQLLSSQNGQELTAPTSAGG